MIVSTSLSEYADPKGNEITITPCTRVYIAFESKVYSPLLFSVPICNMVRHLSDATDMSKSVMSHGK